MTLNTTPSTNASALEPDLVDVLVSVASRPDSCIVTLAGRVIVEQVRRDSKPELGRDVTLVKGGFLTKSGPGRCPTIGKNDAVLLVRGVDRVVALAEGYGGDGTVEPPMTDFWVMAAERRHAAA